MNIRFCESLIGTVMVGITHGIGSAGSLVLGIMGDICQYVYITTYLYRMSVKHGPR